MAAHVVGLMGGWQRPKVEPVPDLFDDPVARYPDTPGTKGRTRAGREAAETMRTSAPVWRDRCLAHVVACGQHGATADECANYLRASVLTIRPRFSELVALGRIRDSGGLRRNAGGRRCTVWVTA